MLAQAATGGGESGPPWLVIVGIVAGAIVSIVVGYWQSHQARNEAKNAHRTAVDADQKASYGAAVALNARHHQVDVNAEIIESFQETLAATNTAFAEVLQRNNERLESCLASEAALTASNNLLTASNVDLRKEVGQLRLEVAEVRTAFEQALRDSHG